MPWPPDKRNAGLRGRGAGASVDVRVGELDGTGDKHPNIEVQPDIAGEWLAMPRPTKEQLAHLADFGITRQAITLAGGVSIINIQVIGRLWLPSPNGASALVMPVFDEDLNLIDLLATRTATPATWWLRVGYEDLVLGAVWLEHAHLTGQPVVHYMTPLDWLAAGGEGVCLLDHCADRSETAA